MKLARVLFLYGLEGVVIAVLAFGALPAAWAKVSATAQLDQRSIHVGESAFLSVRVQSDAGEELKDPEITAPVGLEIIFRDYSSSSSITFSNGRMTSINSLEYHYNVVGLKEGGYTLNNIKVPVGNASISVSPVSLKVLAGAPQPTPPPGTQQRAKANAYGIVFLSEQNKNEVYVGEEAQLTYIAFFPITVTKIQLDDRRGQFQNFWTETFDMMDTRYHEQKTFNGRPYLQVPIRRYFLFPLTASEATIEPLHMVCEVIPDPSRNFRFFFGGDSKPADVTSDSVTLQVKPLPAEKQPDIFKGAVGQFEMSAKVESLEVREGDPVTLKVILKGRGNVRNAPPPVLPDLSKFDTFDPTKNENIQVNLDGVSGEITYTHILMPHDVNANKIGPVRYAFFDPAKKEYVTLQTPEIALKILPSAQGNRRGTAFTGANRRMITRIGEDFRFIAVTPAALATVMLPLYEEWTYWFWAISPLGLLIAAYVLKRRAAFAAQNPDRMKSRRASRLAHRLLANARQAIQKNDAASTYSALAKAVTDFISHRWNLSCAGLTSEVLRQALLERGVDGGCAGRVLEVLNDFDGARFSVVQLDQSRMQEDYRRAEQMIMDLMKQKA